MVQDQRAMVDMSHKFDCFIVHATIQISSRCQKKLSLQSDTIPERR